MWVSEGYRGLLLCHRCDVGDDDKLWNTIVLPEGFAESLHLTDRSGSFFINKDASLCDADNMKIFDGNVGVTGMNDQSEDFTRVIEAIEKNLVFNNLPNLD